MLKHVVIVHLSEVVPHPAMYTWDNARRECSLGQTALWAPPAQELAHPSSSSRTGVVGVPNPLPKASEAGNLLLLLLRHILLEKVKLVKILSFRLTGVQIAARKQAGVFLVLWFVAGLPGGAYRSSQCEKGRRVQEAHPSPSLNGLGAKSAITDDPCSHIVTKRTWKHGLLVSNNWLGWFSLYDWSTTSLEV